MNVLIVCSGNQYRSIMAEALWRSEYPDHKYKSAGTNAHAEQNRTINKNVKKHLKSIGLNCKKDESEPVTKKLIKWADLILTAAPSHTNTLLNDFKCKKTIKEIRSLGETVKRITDPGTSYEPKEVAIAQMEVDIRACLQDPEELI